MLTTFIQVTFMVTLIAILVLDAAKPAAAKEL